MRRVSRRQFIAGSVAAAATGTGRRAPMVWAQANFLEPVKIRSAYAPYTSVGPYFIAKAKGYFRKLGIELTDRSVADHSLVMPALAAGEIDLTSATTSAGLFNAMAKGTPIKLFMERAREAPGMGSNAILVSNELYAKGFTNLDGYKHAKGQKIGMAARGSVAHYMHVTALERVGLTANDVDWQWGMEPSVSVQLLATNRIGLANLALPGAYAAAKKGAGRIVAWSDDIKPNFVLVLAVVNEKFLAAHYSAVVRFGMAMLQANREYNAAAKNGNPEILNIIAEGTGLPASVIDETRPRWALMSEDGLPDIPSVMEQQRFWHERTDLLVKTVPEDQLFTLKAIKEARARLDERNPFV